MSKEQRQPVEIALLAVHRASVQQRELFRLLSTEGDPLDSRLSRLAIIVTTYAVTGVREMTLPQLEDALAEFTCALWGDASHSRPVPGTLGNHGRDPIGQTVDACRARIALEHEESVPLVHLAALAGVGLSSIYASMRQKSLELSHSGFVTPASAKRWLGKKGCPGFDKPVLKVVKNG